MDAIPVDAIDELVRYLWRDEKSNFDSALGEYLDSDNSKAFPDDHIFLSLKKVARWLSGLRVGDYEARSTVRGFLQLADSSETNG